MRQMRTPSGEVGSQNVPATERGHAEGPWEGETRRSTGFPSRLPRGTCLAGHPEGSALESGEWLMSTFRCAANGAARSWISPIQVPGKPGRPTSSGPAWSAAATFGRRIPRRKRPMLSSGPTARGNATLAATPRASCLRVPQVPVWSAAIPDERAVGQA